MRHKVASCRFRSALHHALRIVAIVRLDQPVGGCYLSTLTGSFLLVRPFLPTSAKHLLPSRISGAGRARRTLVVDLDLAGLYCRTRTMIAFDVSRHAEAVFQICV
jgi:hypothetical protein